MYEVFWNWFVAMMKVVVGLKMSITKYIANKPNNSTYANGVNIWFQSSLIYFN